MKINYTVFWMTSLTICSQFWFPKFLREIPEPAINGCWNERSWNQENKRKGNVPQRAIELWKITMTNNMCEKIFYRVIQ